MFFGDYYLTRLIFQRALALVYLIAFLVVLHQFKPLLGEKGLLPVPQFVKQIRFSDAPSLFFFLPKNSAFMLFGGIGVILSLLALTGISERFGTPISMIIWGSLWLIYLSFVNVGQTFYSFGWETMLLETGFLAIFLGAADTKAPALVIWLIRWELFRVMFGAGLIKLRGDPCWKDLTCLFYHHETQPIPNPLSWYFHWLPREIHKASVLFNHFVELIVPFAYFIPISLIAAAAGLFTLLFHGLLAVSGNFAFLGFLTMVLAIATFDDSIILRVFPFLENIIPASSTATATISVFHTYAVWGLAIIVALLSIKPILNLLSPRQIMNTSFDSLHLVNTYGAFGSITKERYEIIIEGTNEDVTTESTRWREYEFIGKPGNPLRRPPQIAPYHLRLDWLMWFATMSSYREHPWFVHLVYKLLLGDKDTLSLLKTNPFPGEPPKNIRALLYRYRFATQEEKLFTGWWWSRRLAGVYFPAVSLSNPEFRQLLQRMDWLEK